MCRKHTHCFYSFSALMKFLFQLRAEQLPPQAWLLAGWVSPQPRSQSLGFFRDVVYSFPMESNTSKLPHSAHGSGSERSLCAGPWPQPGDCWGSAGAQSPSLPFLQVGKLPLSSAQALHLSQLMSPLHAARAVPPTGQGRQEYPVHWGFSGEGPQLIYPRARKRA